MSDEHMKPPDYLKPSEYLLIAACGLAVTVIFISIFKGCSA